MQKQFGALMLAFTDKFELSWNDQGSGANKDVSFYQPIAPKDFHALGTVAVGKAKSDFNPNDRVAVLCVKPVSGTVELDDKNVSNGNVSKRPALAFPADYENIWSDKKTGSDKDGSCWRPIPPAGYKALGDVVVVNYNKPARTLVVCVREDLTYEGKVGEQIWSDEDSGSQAQDFSTWEIDVFDKFVDQAHGLFGATTFIGVSQHKKPATRAEVNTLRLPVPAESKNVTLTPPSIADSVSQPGGTAPVVDHIVTVPFTSVVDNDKKFAWKMEHPFYRIERSIMLDAVGFTINNTSADQMYVSRVETGVSESQSKSFTLTTGISVSVGGEASVGGTVSAPVGLKGTSSITLTTTLGWTTSSSSTTFANEASEVRITVPAHHKVGLWTTKHLVRVIRDDDSPVSGSLAFTPGHTTYHITEFPPGATPPYTVEPTTPNKK
jgi:hypothetical protein